jgi:C1A family cysteine protease
MNSTKFPFRHFLQVIGLCSLTLFSCEKDKDDNKPNNNKSTGWFGQDNTNEIPANVNNPFDADPSTLPTAIDLTQFFPPVGDQGQFGTCVAWATAYNCKSALEAIKFGLTQQQLASANYQLSAKYLYLSIPSDKKNGCNGTDFVPALDVMLNKGVATKAAVPYTDLGNCSSNDLNGAGDADAAKHKIKFYRKIDFTATAIRQALAARMPVILGAKLDDSFMQWNSETVYQSHTSFDNVGIHSYHAMCIVGYDNFKGPRGAFKVVNSWSPNWGSGGFIWVDYNFMINGFAFNKNLYVAVNDDQRPDPSNPDPPVGTNGVELSPWVDSEGPELDSGGTWRRINFDIYNEGTQAANAEKDWGYAYLYYNAFDAEDYGIVFYDRFKNVGTYKTITYGITDVQSGATGFTIHVNIPSGSSFSKQLFAGQGISRTYPMPADLNGYYYLVLVVDATDKFVENDESNNLFYTTDQDPKLFFNGIGERKANSDQRDVFKNILTRNQIHSKEAKAYRTAVKPHNPNAYTPQEIIGFLKKEARNGGLARKLAAAKGRNQGRAGSLSAGK